MIDLLFSLIDVKWLLGGLAGLVAVIIASFRGEWRGAAKERSKQQQKELDAYEQHNEDLARAANSGRGRLPDYADDPHNRDAKR